MPRLGGPALTRGLVVGYLSIMVLLPIAAVVSRSFEEGWQRSGTRSPAKQAVAAMELTLIASLVVVAINAVFGTIIAWVLVRDEFPGKRYVNAIIDLPFALPTIVAGLTLLALYGDNGILGISGVSFTKIGDRHGAAVRDPPVRRPGGAAGAARARPGHGGGRRRRSARSPLTIFRRIVLPNLAPAMFAGVALAFARAIGEFGSLILISGNIPFDTEVASVFIFKQVEAGNETAAAAVSVVLLAVSVGVLFLINFLGKQVRSP